jgi:hypothetical protein
VTAATDLGPCPVWCDYPHDEPDSGHWVEFLPDEDKTRTHGPLMSVSVQTTDRGTELWVDLSCDTLTADMADRLADALKRGAEILRTRDDAVSFVRMEPYPDPDSSGFVLGIRHTPSR